MKAIIAFGGRWISVGDAFDDLLDFAIVILSRVLGFSQNSRRNRTISNVMNLFYYHNINTGSVCTLYWKIQGP